MTDYPALCRCDRALDARGMCPHCDAPPTRIIRTPTGLRYECPPRCPDCYMRDQHCPICGASCGTRSAALNHESRCRRAEIAAEKKKGA